MHEQRTVCEWSFVCNISAYCICVLLKVYTCVDYYHHYSYFCCCHCYCYCCYMYIHLLLHNFSLLLYLDTLDCLRFTDTVHLTLMEQTSTMKTKYSILSVLIYNGRNTALTYIECSFLLYILAFIFLLKCFILYLYSN